MAVILPPLCFLHNYKVYIMFAALDPKIPDRSEGERGRNSELLWSDTQA